jgi:hypothetical protein
VARKKVTVRRFKSMQGYRDWLAFKSIHLPRSKGNERIIIAGHRHKVKHGR